MHPSKSHMRNRPVKSVADFPSAARNKSNLKKIREERASGGSQDEDGATGGTGRSNKNQLDDSGHLSKGSQSNQ